jgi:AcrR family transcriptional regulator
MRDPRRSLRVDAQRNREKILSAALHVFTEHGMDTTFERIAREADVGVATLYRNFPTREVLYEAVYRNELTRLCAAAPDLLNRLPSADALRAWMGRFIDYATSRIGMADALRSVIDAGGNPYAQAGPMMLDAVSLLLAAGVTAGMVRSDITAPDVLASLTGIALASGRPEQRDKAERLLDLLMDGLSAHAIRRATESASLASWV